MNVELSPWEYTTVLWCSGIRLLERLDRHRANGYKNTVMASLSIVHTCT